MTRGLERHDRSTEGHSARAIVDREIARLAAEGEAEEPTQQPAELTEWPESGPRRSP